MSLGINVVSQSSSKFSIAILSKIGTIYTMQTSVKFHYIHIINCLPSADAGGSRRLLETIQDISSAKDSPQPLYSEVRSASEFLSALTNIESNISDVNIPLIHIDAHADKERGLEFFLDNNTAVNLSWNEITDALGQINAKISNRLFVVFCACSAFNINSELHPRSVAPFSVCVSPLSTVTLHQIEENIPYFYRALMIHHDIIRAAEAVEGIFYLVSSEYFLKDVLVKRERTTIGKQGRERREELLTEIIRQSEKSIDLNKARKHIKNSLSVTDEKIRELSSIYLCGRAVPFTAEQIRNEARQSSLEKRDP